MTEIGVIGSDETADTLNEIYAMTDDNESGGARIRRIDNQSAGGHFHVLVINDAGFLAPMFLKELEPCDAIVINADNKKLYSYLGGSRGRLITYGFSGKACVTASSVIDKPYECVLLCIQRGLPTLTGKVLEPQEFPVSFKTPRNIYSVLGAVTAALIAGMPVGSFQ